MADMDDGDERVSTLKDPDPRFDVFDELSPPDYVNKSEIDVHNEEVVRLMKNIKIDTSKIQDRDVYTKQHTSNTFCNF